MSRRRSFRKWLERQTDRRDAVGDFARDALRDEEFPAQPDAWDTVSSSLLLAGASAPAVEAAKKAWAEFRRTSGGMP